jgi:hypothetical protein
LTASSTGDITSSRKENNWIKNKELYWLIGKKSHLSIDKLLIYKTVIKPIWTYGIQLWGCPSKSNIALIQRAQSKILRTIANASCYVSSHTVHIDLKTPYVSEVTKEYSTNYFHKLANHPNPLLRPLLHHHDYRRIRRNWPEVLKN